MYDIARVKQFHGAKRVIHYGDHMVLTQNKLFYVQHFSEIGFHLIHHDKNTGQFI